VSQVFFDSMLWAYLLEAHPEFGRPVRSALETVQARGHRLVTSAFAIGEVLVAPVAKADRARIDRANGFFNARVTVLEFRRTTVMRFAEIRARHRVSASDAVNLACAAEAGVDLFLTNDKRLQGKIVPGIQFISSLENAPL